MTARLGYFTLGTLDIDKARVFFGALFGWRFDEQASSETYAHVADSDPACGFTKVEQVRDHSSLYFRVEDIDAACAEVDRLGGRAAIPADSESGRSVSVSDNQGMSFSLWQPAPGLVD